MTCHEGGVATGQIKPAFSFGTVESMVPEHVEDAGLAQAACDSPTAFATLYERYRDRIYWYVLTRTATPEDAADLLQQVFLQALERIGQYEAKKGPFVGWLFGIARHAAINHHRGLRVTVSWDLVPEVLRPVSKDDPERETLRNESLEWLASAFAALDPGKRELLVLRYIVGLSFPDISAIVGKREPAVRQRVSRMLRLLQEENRKDQKDDNA